MFVLTIYKNIRHIMVRFEKKILVQVDFLDILNTLCKKHI